MAFDTELDKKLWGKDINIGDFTLNVSVMSYDEHTPKIQISRRKEDKFLKLGRLSLEEANALIPVIKKAIEEAKNPTEDQQKLDD